MSQIRLASAAVVVVLALAGPAGAAPDARCAGAASGFSDCERTFRMDSQHLRVLTCAERSFKGSIVVGWSIAGDIAPRGFEISGGGCVDHTHTGSFKKGDRASVSVRVLGSGGWRVRFFS